MNDEVIYAYLVGLRSHSITSVVYPKEMFNEEKPSPSHAFSNITGKELTVRSKKFVADNLFDIAQEE